MAVTRHSVTSRPAMTVSTQAALPAPSMSDERKYFGPRWAVRVPAVFRPVQEVNAHSRATLDVTADGAVCSGASWAVHGPDTRRQDSVLDPPTGMEERRVGKECAY